MRLLLIACSLLGTMLCLAAKNARNVILFLGDAGGIPTLHAASVYGHEHSQKLFIQGMPHIALMDTSALDAWVTDSAAGMTAIMTGYKVKNGYVSHSAPGENGKPEGEAYKTLLDHAEERGLSTGVISNMWIVDATPAACYAHSTGRKKYSDIFKQLFAPTFGDGADIVIGAGREKVTTLLTQEGIKVDDELRRCGYDVLANLSDFRPEQRRAVHLYDGNDFDPVPLLDKVLKSLASNPKGYFLMFEWDMHTPKPKKGLDRALVMDRLVKHAVSIAGEDTLVIFTADHSFDLRMRAGTKGVPLFTEAGEPAAPKPDAKTYLRMDDTHTGEQVLVAASGPGAERIHGFIDNTDLFHLMLKAYGWE